MNFRKKMKLAVITLLVLSNLGCDQVSKVLVRQEIEPHSSIKLLGNNLTLTRVENTGAFLSAGSNLPEFLRLLLLIALPGAILLYGLYYIIVSRQASRLFIIGMSFVIGGGIGNLYDRILYGSVTDFLHLDLVLFQTGIFNFADVSVMLGVGMIFLDIQLTRSRKKQLTETH